MFYFSLFDVLSLLLFFWSHFSSLCFHIYINYVCLFPFYFIFSFFLYIKLTKLTILKCCIHKCCIHIMYNTTGVNVLMNIMSRPNNF